MRQCQDCAAWFEPRAPKLKVCIRCEAYWTLLSLKSEALAEAQLALPFPLFSSSSRRRRDRNRDQLTDSRSRRAAGDRNS